MTHSLVAPVKDELTGYSGMPLAEELLGTVGALGRGDWAEGLADTTVAALDALGAITDPLKVAIAAGVGWVIEHCGPLRHALDLLAGDPHVIESYAETWKNVSEALKRDAEELAAAIRRDTATWHSAAVDAYRQQAAGHLEQLEVMGTTATCVSTAVTMGGVVVATVRATVRDLVSEAVGTIISKALQAVTVVLIPKVVPEIIEMVAKWSVRIAEWLRKATRVISRLVALCRRLEPILKRADEWNDVVGKRIDDAVAKVPVLRSDRLDGRTASMFSKQEYELFAPRVSMAKDAVLEGSKPLIAAPEDGDGPESSAERRTEE